MNEKNKRWWDIPSSVLLLVALFASALRLQTTNWTNSLDLLQLLVLVGLALGLMLGLSRFNAWLSFFFGLVYSVTIVPWVLGGQIHSESWLEKLHSLSGRLAIAGGQLLGRQPVQDSLLFLSFMCVLYWLASLYGGYQLTRNGKPWASLVVTGFMILIVDYSFEMYGVSDSGSPLSLIFFLFVVMLIGRVYYLGSRMEWKSRSQAVENEVGYDLGRGTAVMALALVLLAWFSPRVVKAFTPGTQENRRISSQFQDFRDQISKAVSSLHSNVPLIVDSLSETLSLGRGSVLSDSTVLIAKPDAGKLLDGRYYWTGRVYDTYINKQWVSTDTHPDGIGPGYANANYTYTGRKDVSVTFTSKVAALVNLYYPQAIITLTRPVTALESQTGESNRDVTALVVEPPLRAGEDYTVRASLSVPTVAQLQQVATKEYPKWVTDRYLQLPEGFSPRIQELARSITQNQKTPYDKAVAVTSWLRANIVYHSTVPPLPAGADPVEWFLFVEKAGFCNYYASAEVLMLRSVGVPTRMVVGYAQGTWIPDQNVYDIAGRDYHAWPEVFFPDLGWVPFEPTGSQPELTFAPGDAGSTDTNPQNLLEPTPFIPPVANQGLSNAELERQLQIIAQRRARDNGLKIGGSVAALGLLAFAYYRWKKYSLKNTPLPTWFERTLTTRGIKPPAWLKMWSIRARRSPMEALFARVPELLRVWGETPATDLTPAEQVSRLTQIVPDLANNASVLLEEYHRSAYSRHPSNYMRAKQAAGDLRLRGYQIWVKRLFSARP